jgi:hypothetical protein
VVIPDERALGEAEDLRLLDAPAASEVDVLDHGVGPEFRRLQGALEATGLPLGELSVDEEAEALVEAESAVVRGSLLVGESRCHGGKLQGMEPLDGCVHEHGGSFHR